MEVNEAVKVVLKNYGQPFSYVTKRFIMSCLDKILDKTNFKKIGYEELDSLITKIIAKIDKEDFDIPRMNENEFNAYLEGVEIFSVYSGVVT